MAEILRPIPFDKLISWILTEYKNSGSVFGIRKFYKNTSGNSSEIFGCRISSAAGPAAGPATQLAQNIAAGYLSGARFIELKTVQIIDGEELRSCIARPCIKAADECYNCEWSTELTVNEAYEEYVKGFILCRILAKEFGISDTKDFLFNMSVGYDFEGITSAKVDTFINDMKDSSGNSFFNSCKKYLYENINMFRNLKLDDVENIEPEISNSITLSTLHGCPPEEVEKIAAYFLKEKNIHTYVKCNPTLLGYDFTRNILDKMGYSYVDFDHTHFKQDLKYPEAVGLISRLIKTASEKNLDFGVKITNTFPVKASQNQLPSEFMYMSGRSLYPLSLNTAAKLSKEFNGKLPVSFSGGVDFFNIKELFKTGIMPVTAATTILKPGGYERFKQLSEELENELSGSFDGIDTDILSELADNVINKERHRKEYRFSENRKTDSALPLFDCYKAPCSNGACPVNQQIPLYLDYVSKRDYENAFKVIAVDNALPAVTGSICNYDCQFKCARLDYESSLNIRDAKKSAVINAQDNFIRNIKRTPLKTEKKAAVIGAGPAGISAAVYLRRNGVPVTVFEKTDRPMGIVEHIIPEFRIPDEMIEKDFGLSVKTGVEYVFMCSEEYNIEELKKEYEFVIIATGAWEKGKNSVGRGKEKLIDALDFLKQSKECGNTLDIGKRVAVIGGGDVAMDCVRTAARTTGVEHSEIVYRRTKEFMPVSREELGLTIDEGIKIRELISPVEYDGVNLKLEKMKLEKREGDDRPSPVPTGETAVLQYDTVISATGALCGNSLMEKNCINLDSRGLPVLNSKYESSVPCVYVSGDCRKGPATIVKAMGSSRIIAMDILEKLKIENDFIRYSSEKSDEEIYEKRGILSDDKVIPEDDTRCLSCGLICEACAEVCPNRANIAVSINCSSEIFKDRHQILHMDGMCNECGNCTVFCPHDGSPYLDKPTLFWKEEDFEDSSNSGFLKLAGGIFRIRDENSEVFDAAPDSGKLSPEMNGLIKSVCDNYSYLFL